jgi:hypothetical protein
MTTPDKDEPPTIDTSVSHSARVWNYWLGGKDHYPIDRQVGDQIAEMYPYIVDQVRHDRAFLGRAVRYLAGEAGIRQFLDIGTGLPTVDNTHEVAQRVAPESRIVYVDNDPLVLMFARALLTSTRQGATAYLHADVHHPEQIIAQAAHTLDFTEPVAIMLLGIMQFIHDDDHARAVVTELMGAVPPGSYLAIAHTTSEVHGEITEEATRHWNQFGKPTMVLRSREQITRLFDGMELLEPGVVSCSRWRLEAIPFGLPDEVEQFCGLARKPEPA